MKSAFLASLFLVASVSPGDAQNSPHSESRHLAFGCRDVAHAAERYLSEHGVATFEQASFQKIAINGRESEPVTMGSLARGRKLKPWMDAQGREITDFKVYWDYADRKTGENLPPGIWRIRMAHYQPQGEIGLEPDEGGCTVVFSLTFETSGANVIAVLPMDSSWGYLSNGRMEREYLDGIYAALQ